MTSRMTIAAAGNVLPAALACISKLGFIVERNDAGLLVAEREGSKFIAEDPLVLLGLIKVHESRGDKWYPSEAEVQALLALDANQGESRASDRADVWEDQGVIMIKCVTAYGDPVELGEEEAREFARRLDEAISRM
jgi:hypothetical protein